MRNVFLIYVVVVGICACSRHKMNTEKIGRAVSLSYVVKPNFNYFREKGGKEKYDGEKKLAVNLFNDSYWEKAVTLKKSIDNLQSLDLNNKVSKIIVAKGTVAICYDSLNYKGVCLIKPSTVKNTLGILNNKVSSIQLMEEPEGVLFCNNKNLVNDYANKFKPKVFGVIDGVEQRSCFYKMSFVQAVGQNKLSSMYIGPGYKIELFKNDKGSGEVLTYSSSKDRGKAILKLPPDWNNAVSSVRITRLD
ncbi:hypothetical protein [Tenacibaculum xiamenense]|uniref:hypothetical protein n=1 Tax=Tenacibaculum xiamenense TaxID=1261553 RepID=UPI003892E8B7